jgi:hypothetical protein
MHNSQSDERVGQEAKTLELSLATVRVLEEGFRITGSQGKLLVGRGLKRMVF